MWNAALRYAPCRGGYRALGSHLESYFVFSSGNISQMPLHIFVVLFNVLKISSASFLSCYISHLERRWVDTKARVDFLLSSILRCDETNFCSLDANLDGLEEDPCPKTEKYLEAHFVCHSLTDGPPSQGWSTSSVKSTSVNSKSTNYADDSVLGAYRINLCPYASKYWRFKSFILHFISPFTITHLFK